jgi:hypothetical protein
MKSHEREVASSRNELVQFFKPGQNDTRRTSAGFTLKA